MKFQRNIAIGGIFLFALTSSALAVALKTELGLAEMATATSISAREYLFDLPDNHFEIPGDPGPTTATAEIAVSGAQINAAGSVPTESLKRVVASAGIPFEITN